MASVRPVRPVLGMETDGCAIGGGTARGRGEGGSGGVLEGHMLGEGHSAPCRCGRCDKCLSSLQQ